MTQLGRQRGKAAERRIARLVGGERVPYSGAGTEKGDVRHPLYQIEVKARGASQLALKREWLDKLALEAASVGKRPVLVFRFVGDTRDWAVLPIGDVPGLVAPTGSPCPSCTGTGIQDVYSPIGDDRLCAACCGSGTAPDRDAPDWGQA